MKLSSHDLHERTDMRGFVGRTAFWSAIFNYSPTISIPKAITMIAHVITPNGYFVVMPARFRLNRAEYNQAITITFVAARASYRVGRRVIFDSCPHK